MSTPHVAGAAAVLRAAWPYLTAVQTVAILLQTANKSFSGYNENIHGQGLLDLGNAVTAQGPNNIAPLSVVLSAGYDARSSSINTGPIFGNAYSNNLAPILKNAVFFDQYGRDYPANLDQKISRTNNSSYDLDNILLTKYSSTALPISFGENYSGNLSLKFVNRNTFSDPISGEITSNNLGLKYLTVDRSKEGGNSFQSSDVALSYSQNIGQNLKIGFSKNNFNNDTTFENPAQNYNLIAYNNFSSSPYKKLGLANFASNNQSQVSSNQLNISQNLTENLITNLSYTSYNKSSAINKFNSDESRVFEGGLSYSLNDKSKLSFNFGNLKELNNNLLGSKAEGAFSGGSNPQTKYISINLTRDLTNQWQFTTSYSEGKTSLSGNQVGVFRDFNDIRSRGMAMGLLNNDFFGGKLGLVYSEPLRVYKGTTNINIPISRDAQGNVQRLVANGVSLKPDGRERDLELSYNFNLKNRNANLSLNSIIQQQANNIKDAKNQYFWIARYNLKF